LGVFPVFLFGHRLFFSRLFLFRWHLVEHLSLFSLYPHHHHHAHLNYPFLGISSHARTHDHDYTFSLFRMHDTLGFNIRINEQPN